MIQFNFLHRFEVSAPPARKVTSFPNFHVATGLPLRRRTSRSTTPPTRRSSAAFPTSTSSRSGGRSCGKGPPEVRWTSASSAGYNFAPQSIDGELTLGRRLGPVRLLGTVRGMSSAYDVQRSLWGAGGGVVVRVTSWLSLAGDVFSLANAPDADPAVTAWGAGAQLRIPYSPHSFSIQVTNTQSASIEGSSRGVRGAHMAGFEFTIPFTLSRYFGHRAKPAAGRTRPASRRRLSGVTVVRIANLSFGGEVRVRAGHPGPLGERRPGAALGDGG